MNEAGVWAYVKKGMAGKDWHATRIESSAGNGVPDVCFSTAGQHGFIEFKYIKEWPKRKTTLVKLPLRPEQKLWLETRGRYGGNCWVFVRVEDDFFIVHWNDIDWFCNGLTREELYSAYVFKGFWSKRVDFDELFKILREGC
jgi:hypothetical protein